MTEETRKVILRAKELVERGWCQEKESVVVDGRSCRCLTQALRVASKEISKEVDNYHDAVVCVADFLGVPRSTIGLAYWNDDDDRTQVEVIAALDVITKRRRRSLTLEQAVSILNETKTRDQYVVSGDIVYSLDEDGYRVIRFNKASAIRFAEMLIAHDAASAIRLVGGTDA